MAAEGTRFLQAYCGTSVCAPSRSSFFTGLHTGHCPVRGNWEWFPEGQYPLPDERVTIAEFAKVAGYATATFGKWGMGFFDTSGSPFQQSVDHFFGYNCQRHARSCFPTYLFNGSQPFVLRGNSGRDVGETNPKSAGCLTRQATVCGAINAVCTKEPCGRRRLPGGPAPCPLAASMTSPGLSGTSCQPSWNSAVPASPRGRTGPIIAAVNLLTQLLPVTAGLHEVFEDFFGLRDSGVAVRRLRDHSRPPRRRILGLAGCVKDFLLLVHVYAVFNGGERGVSRRSRPAAAEASTSASRRLCGQPQTQPRSHHTSRRQRPNSWHGWGRSFCLCA